MGPQVSGYDPETVQVWPSGTTCAVSDEDDAIVHIWDRLGISENGSGDRTTDAAIVGSGYCSEFSRTARLLRFCGARPSGLPPAFTRRLEFLHFATVSDTRIVSAYRRVLPGAERYEFRGNAVSSLVKRSTLIAITIPGGQRPIGL